METDFVSWLMQERDKHGWSDSELARRAEVVPSTVSMIFSRQKQPGLEFCRGVARALHKPPDLILRIAGLLPPEPEETASLKEAVFLFSHLDEDEQEQFLTLMRGLMQLKQQGVRSQASR